MAQDIGRKGGGGREDVEWKATVAYPGIFFGRGFNKSVEDRDDGDLGAAAPYSGVLEAAVIWYKKFHFI